MWKHILYKGLQCKVNNACSLYAIIDKVAIYSRPQILPGTNFYVVYTKVTYINTLIDVMDNFLKWIII